MKSFGVLVGVLGLIWSATQAQPFKGVIPTQGLIFPQIVVGGTGEISSESEINLLAQGADDSEGDVRIYAQNGQPLPVRVNGSAPMSEFTYSLTSGSSASFVLTSDSEALTVGFAVVLQNKPADQTTEGASQNRARDKSGALTGQVTFRLRSGEDLTAQVAALPAKELSKAQLMFNNTGGNRTALAVASLQESSLSISLHDEAGQELESKQEAFNLMTQRALFVDELFPASQGSRGSLLIDATEPFFGLSLDQNGLLLSSGGLFPGVIEREIVVDLQFAVLLGTLRVVQEGPLLTGTIRLRDSATGVEGPLEPISGVFFGAAGTEQYFLLLSWGAGITQLLVTDRLDRNLEGDAIGVVRSVISTGLSIGAIFATGLFQLSKKESAQF